MVGSFVARPLGLALTGPIAVAVGFHEWLLVVGCVMGGSALLALTSSTSATSPATRWPTRPPEPVTA